MSYDVNIVLASLATHKLRTFLAILGVFVGALALTGVQHVSLAMVRNAEIETEKLGPNLFMVRSGRVRVRRSGSVRASAEARNFSLADARELIETIPESAAGVPFVQTSMNAKSGSIKVPARMIATKPLYTQVRNFKPEYGRFFSDEEVRSLDKVVVLGRTVAEKLFGSPEAAMGEKVFFFRAAARVIGVMEEKGADISGEDQDEQVFVPITTYMRRFANQDWISGVYMSLHNAEDAQGVEEKVTKILRENHRLSPGEPNDFSVLTAKDTMRLQKQALDLVGTLGFISSSVSFAVGGLGILSIMVLLVRARRLEIGVRRAVGATRHDIIRQFLFEAGLLSTVGGACGVACGLLLVLAVSHFGGFPLVFAPEVVTGALVGSAVLGLAAGAYPAWRASRYQILDVLKAQE
jgi:putative ABC transport system permease protein